MKKSSFNTNVEKMRRLTNSLEQKGDTEQLRYIRDGLYHVGGVGSPKKTTLKDLVRKLIYRKKSQQPQQPQQQQQPQKPQQLQQTQKPQPLQRPRQPQKPTEENINNIVDEYTINDINEYHYGVNINKLVQLLTPYNIIEEDTYWENFYRLFEENMKNSYTYGDMNRYYTYYVFIRNYLKNTQYNSINNSLIYKIIKIYNNAKKKRLSDVVEKFFPLDIKYARKNFDINFNTIFYNDNTDITTIPTHERLENNEYYFYLETLLKIPKNDKV